MNASDGESGRTSQEGGTVTTSVISISPPANDELSSQYISHASCSRHTIDSIPPPTRDMI